MPGGYYGVLYERIDVEFVPLPENGLAAVSGSENRSKNHGKNHSEKAFDVR
jgi:hypothetical protein